MAVLTTQQRNRLESAVKQARKLSETGARNALHRLAVDHTEPFAHMPADQRALRNRLRNKARLLGDELSSNDGQGIYHLAYELAYEYWHKMLFVKFLEANGLLIHSDGVAVTMEECEELACEEGFADKWDAAASYASKMLPAIFRTDDPLMQVNFATEDRIKLEGLLDGLDPDIFTADDSLGWVYQFWQSEAKETIKRSGDKIDGEKLPAMTQFFTEPYMVHFLIDNTIGAWWVSRHPGVTPPVKFEYLRLLEDGAPAAGKFEGWPDTTALVTALDPCMGSGHFVAALFPVFALLRMYEEGLSREEATDRVITENLHGLELDARCTQIAAFNLALTTWRFCGHYKELPEMNLACCGIAPKGRKEDWVKLVGRVADPGLKSRMENGMKVLYDHFQLAPELGSLLDPSTIETNLATARFDELQPTLIKALENEGDKDQVERGVVAAGIAKAGRLLSKIYTLQITNVPYLARGKQDDLMRDFCEKNYPEAKNDLATVFLDRCLVFCEKGGTVSVVLPQNWLFAISYKRFREKLLKNDTWHMLARLGAAAFETISGEVVKSVLFILSRGNLEGAFSLFKQQDVSSAIISGLDVSKPRTTAEKAVQLKTAEIKQVEQVKQLVNPDARVGLEENEDLPLLSKYADGLVGLQTSDDPMFTTAFWEFDRIDKKVWEYLQGAPETLKEDAGASWLVRWEQGQGLLLSLPTARPTQGLKAIGKEGIAIHRVGTIFAYHYYKERFHQNIAVIIPKREQHHSAIWSFCSSSEFTKAVRRIDQRLNVTNATLVKIPFDLEYWQKIAEEKYPYGLPKPYSNDPTQWIFHGHPIKAENPLEVSIARLLGYRWPAESDTKMELAEEAKELIKAVKAFDTLTDDDGILCIPSVNGELTASERLRSFLQAVYGSEWNNQTVAQLLAKEGATKSDFEDWLRNEFFDQHCKLFHNRPFIWHIWDGRKDGFAALVNYHKLDKETLQRLIYTYLGDWIRQCEAKKKDGESGAEGLLSAALKLKEKLEAILEGEAPYDIFVRWKPLEKQPIGWEPDMNDGVRLNIRPFIQADVLRKKPNIKWGIDRGKNPPGSPWGETRDNDKHLSLTEKKAARVV